MDSLSQLKEQKAELDMQILEKMQAAARFVRELEQAKVQQQTLRLKILSSYDNNRLRPGLVGPKRFWT